MARINTYDSADDDYKGVSLKKVPTRLGDNNEATFIVNEDDEYSFAASDILMKLPNSLTVGGSSRKNHHQV